MNTARVFIITGQQGEGKTTKLMEVVEKLKQQQLNICGFVAPGYWEGDLRAGFDIVDVNSGMKMILCQNEPNENFLKVGRFYFNPEAIKFGESLLQPESKNLDSLAIIDEIGIFELKGKLWANPFIKLLETSQNKILITTRDKFLDGIIENFKLTNIHVFDLDQSLESMLEKISS